MRPSEPRVLGPLVLDVGMKMKKSNDKFLWLAFIIGTLSPFLALIVKPQHYSFYMFLPATPETSFEKLQLITGNSLLVFGFMLALLAATFIAVRGARKRNFITLLCPIVVLANPLQQPIFFESLDTRMNYLMRDKAEELQIIGKTPEQVRQLLGKANEYGPNTPKIIDPDGKVTWEDDTYITWEYQPLPFYWLGSRFQVFFVDGKVRNYEANDD